MPTPYEHMVAMLVAALDTLNRNETRETTVYVYPHHYDREKELLIETRDAASERKVTLQRVSDNQIIEHMRGIRYHSSVERMINQLTTKE